MRFGEIPAPKFAARVIGTDGQSLQPYFEADALQPRETPKPGQPPKVALVAGQPVSILEVKARSRPNQFALVLPVGFREALVEVQFVEAKYGERLAAKLAESQHTFAQLTMPAADGSALLEVVTFAAPAKEMAPIEIGIDDTLRKRLNDHPDFKQFMSQRHGSPMQWLERQSTFEFGGEQFYFLTAGPAVADYLTSDWRSPSKAFAKGGQPDKLNLDTEVAGVKPTVTNSFGITGGAIRYVVTKTEIPDRDPIWVVSKLNQLPINTDKAIQLAHGKLTFTDWTSGGEISRQTQLQLNQMQDEKNGYLAKWDEYAALEGDLLLERARKVGLIAFERLGGQGDSNKEDGTISVILKGQVPKAAREILADGNAVEIVDGPPEYLTEGYTFAEFSQKLTEDMKGMLKKGRRQKKAREFVAIKGNLNPRNELRLKTENLPASGQLTLSIWGDTAQIKRRLKAREAILTGRSANPQLGLIIEEKGKPTKLRPPVPIEPLTPFVRERVFPDNPPTERQIEAIRVALNTPDIAMIQGPPGTGKTTVIHAILERLNEEQAKKGLIGRGQVLLSAFQHDAVENMNQRIWLNGIPVPKFGSKRGQEEETSRYQQQLADWAAVIANNIREHHPQLAALGVESKVKDLHIQYLGAPNLRVAISLLGAISQVDAAIVGADVKAGALKLAASLEQQEQAAGTPPNLLVAARRIRTNVYSFLDDGPEQAAAALAAFEFLDHLNPDQPFELSSAQAETLEQASALRARIRQCRDNPQLLEQLLGPHLARLRQVKSELLDQLTAPPVFRIEKHNVEVLELSRQAINQIETSGLNALEPKLAALAELVNELGNNPAGLVDAIAEYCFAFSATVQQSVNPMMQAQKGLFDSEDTQSLEYEFVIIDEAARVSPLDLLIPMAQGKKVILVGDHRQLPQLLNDEVTRRMEDESNEETAAHSDWLKRSMFEYLFADRLDALEAGDKIPRKVTLDKQYRMHPQLGEFVSENFYQVHAEREKFESPLPKGHPKFIHNLPGTQNHAAIWINVPTSAGTEVSDATGSRKREAEARVIVEKLAEWLVSPQGQRLTYGIIAFHKYQATYLEELLGSRLKDHFGTDNVKEWKNVRVGTVDSFQGMEFDVVFLSVVRTAQPTQALTGLSEEKAKRKAFGFLTTYNRLNVSMSRQKRLLVAVGDAALVDNELARKHVTGLANFYRQAYKLEMAADG